MAKQSTFPIRIMAGSSAIRIYRDPLKSSLAKADKREGTQVPGDRKNYDSYVVSYYQGGKRLRNRFNSLQDAKDKADAVKTKLLNNDSTALGLTGQDSLIYARAKNVSLTLAWHWTK